MLMGVCILQMVYETPVNFFFFEDVSFYSPDWPRAHANSFSLLVECCDDKCEPIPGYSVIFFFFLPFCLDSLWPNTPEEET